MSTENDLFETVQTLEDVPSESQPSALMQVIKAEHVEEHTGVQIRDAFAPLFAAAEKLAAKAKAEADAKLKAEREARERLESEIRARAQAEADEKERRRVEAEKVLSASDDVKLEAFAAMLDNLPFPVVTSQIAAQTLKFARDALANVSASIRSKVATHE